MPRDDLEEQVIAIIAAKKKLDPSLISAESTFVELGVDSLETMDLLFTFEDKFQIDIPDAVAMQMTTIRRVTEALRPILDRRPAA